MCSAHQKQNQVAVFFFFLGGGVGVPFLTHTRLAMRNDSSCPNRPNLGHKKQIRFCPTAQFEGILPYISQFNLEKLHLTNLWHTSVKFHAQSVEADWKFGGLGWPNSGHKTCRNANPAPCKHKGTLQAGNVPRSPLKVVKISCG